MHIDINRRQPRTKSYGAVVAPLAAALVAAMTVSACWHRSPEAARQAAMLKACNAGEISCVKPAESRTIVQCQAGDIASCQTLAAQKCNSGDRHICQSLAVLYSQLNPLCRAGNAEACKDMKAPWPDSDFWQVDNQIAAAKTACKNGDAKSCHALGTTVRAGNGRLIWFDSYIAPTNAGNADTVETPLPHK